MASLQYPSLPTSTNDLSILLKQESLDDLLGFSPLPSLSDEDAFGSAPLLGIYADINLRERMLEEQAPSVCVNPADIMGDSSGISAPLLDHQTPADRPLSPAQEHTSASDEVMIEGSFSDEAISAIVTVLQTSAKQEPQEPPSMIVDGDSHMSNGIQPCQLIAPQPVYPNQLLAFPKNDPRMHHPSLANVGGQAVFPGPRIPLADIQMQQIQQIPYSAFGTYAPFDFSQGFLPPVVSAPPPSPVLNAHTGISLEDLRQRANDYRLRHPIAELDKNFLQSFAGRLSARGELLDEYRCYVNGCGQRNKRRDHILVHVGSHVEHRPWRCEHCGMRFLRKNECKRHESSHGGRKPFSCQICAPHQERNFVRQDLLKRHMRVTHGVHDTSRVTKKRAETKRQEDAEYWP
ncbi:hypothetical protein FKP32DRAFT_1565082 [Trametes sanguinea]|nr:hypothetical protein FKP32DRAFT_1565082 [Trametes sanguinea]